MKIYIIQDIIGQGFWSESYKNFKGYLYASQYTTMEEAELQATVLTKPVIILTVYL